MRKRILHSIILTVLAAASAHAQSGTLDLDFGINGVVNEGQGENGLYGTAMAVRPNGNIVLAGTISTGLSETNKQMACMELAPDGEVLALNFYGADDRDDYANGIAIQPDGKLILAGYSSPAGDPFAKDIQLIRIDLDGSLDASFGSNGIVITDFSQSGTPTSELANALSILPNGKILIAGTGESGFEKMLLAQYSADGQLDVAGFGTGGRTYTAVGSQPAFANGMEVLSDGRILAVGYTIDEQPALARFSSNGNLDVTFGNNGFANFNGFSGIAFSVAVQSSGKIVIGNQGAGGMEIFRVSSEGAFDPTFGFLGAVSTFIFPSAGGVTPATVLAQPDDRLVLVGTNENGQYRALRYTPNGTPDATFGNAGSFTLPGSSSAANCAALQADGKLLLGGYGRVNLTRSFLVVRLLNELTVTIAEADGAGTLAVLYPNPVVDRTTVTYSLDRSAKVSIVLYDAKGAMVQTLLGQVERLAGTNKESLDLTGLPAGKYVLGLTTGDRKVQLPLMHF